MTIDPLYVVARRVLLDALQSLEEHLDAVVVVGAQAVYLRTGDIDIGVAAFTTDGDLVLDAARLAESPLLGDVMSERFVHAREAGGAEKPGVWMRNVELRGKGMTVPVDLIVPEGLAPPGGSRGARLGPHGKRAARRAPGLEAAVVDNDPMVVPSLDPDDDRRVECKVAGPTALLIAKAHKIEDRLIDRHRPDRLVDKDAADVYRLMQTTPPGRVAEVHELLQADHRVAEPSQRGLELLRQQFGARRAPGVEMAVRALRLGVPEERVRTVCVSFVAAIS